jgi:NADPH:quinone reductase-like Zn-dependent oxidoreductase
VDARRGPGHRHRPGARAARHGETHGRAEIINFEESGVYDRLQEMTDGRGPDRCIDAVALEAHAAGDRDDVLDKAKTIGA